MGMPVGKCEEKQRRSEEKEKGENSKVHETVSCLLLNSARNQANFAVPSLSSSRFCKRYP